MRIALDTLGGQYAPEAIVEGAVQASQRWEELRLNLVGHTATLRSLIDRFQGDSSRFTFLEGPNRIEEGESPVEAFDSKPKASILVAVEALRKGKVDAVVSAGSTGAQIVASMKKLGLLEGVLRPAIGGYFPTEKGKTFILDVGANVNCRPIHLLQFAAMGTIFRQYLDGIQEPKVALLSNGEESSKGTETTRDAYHLMEIVPQLHFTGYIEGRDIYTGKADVIVCDGFLGNILLKFAESIPQMLSDCCREPAIAGNGDRKLLLDHLMRAFDYQEFGGVPLLGVNGISIICHGTSTPKAITSAIGEAVKMARLQVNDKIAEELKTLGHWSAVIRTKALIGRFRRRSSGEKS
jgi:glycerol-3-phosphate acyltransferase PlsX